ncbi:hypothetical protein EDB83DRAFT_2452495 [Lactarius deliciosus]|nr:hypothetical protein EDB83DRAFT_2452495 [Lactarius deliciosus]
MPDIVTSVISTSDPIPETSTPAPPLSSTSLPTAVSLQHNAGLSTPFNAPNIPSSNPVPNDIVPTEPPSSMIVTSAPSTSPGLTSAPDVDATAKDDGRTQLGLRKERDALAALEVDQAIHTRVALGPPPSRSITKLGVVIAGPSREPDADHPPHTSHGRYDMV